MYRAVLLFVCVVLAAADEELLQKCRNFNQMQMVVRCCNELPYKSPKQSDTTARVNTDLRECYMSSTNDYEALECMAKKQGIYGADGKLDFDVLTSFLELEFEQSPELLGPIKENCLNQESASVGNYTKIQSCTIKQIVESCFEWSNTSPCNASQIKEIAEVCKNIY